MRVVVAGTFGPLHDGHRALFRAALERGDDGVLVGLTGDDLAVETRHEPRPVPPFDERRRAVEAAIDDLGRWGRDVEVVRLTDEHGPAVDDPDLDAIVVSPETDEEVAEINRRRRARGLDPLEVVVVPFVRAEDGGRISSTRIVRGEIDEHGNLLDDGRGERAGEERERDGGEDGADGRAHGRDGADGRRAGPDGDAAGEG